MVKRGFSLKGSHTFTLLPMHLKPVQTGSAVDFFFPVGYVGNTLKQKLSQCPFTRGGDNYHCLEMRVCVARCLPASTRPQPTHHTQQDVGKEQNNYHDAEGFMQVLQDTVSKERAIERSTKGCLFFLEPHSLSSYLHSLAISLLYGSQREWRSVSKE